MMRIALAFLACVMASSAGATILYDADWESATATGNAVFTPGAPTNAADWSNENSCNQPYQYRVVRVARQGNYGGRILLRDDLPGTTAKDIRRGVERCEMVLRGNGDVAPYGATRWYAWSILIPTDNQFEAGDTYALGNSTCHFQIIYDTTGTSYPTSFHMRMKDNRWRVWVYGQNASGVETQFETDLGAIQKSKWWDFILEHKPHITAGQAKTYLRVRYDGGAWATKIDSTSSNAVASMVTGSEGHAKSGQYRPGETSNGNAVIYHDGPRVATTEAEALAFFDVGAGATTQIATPGSLDIDWGDGTASAIWTQAGESNVDNWTVQQCWDARTCVESTAATKTIDIVEPWGKSLVLRVRANGKAGYADSEWGSLTEARAYPEAVENFRMAGATVAATEITSASTITLSASSPIDWVHWGHTLASDENRKSGASIQIGAMASVIAAPIRLAGNSTRPPMAWTGGTPTATEAGTTGYLTHDLAAAVVGSGFSLSAPAASTARVLRLYLVANKEPATLATTFNGATQQTVIGTSGSITYWNVAITYSGAGALSATWLKTNATNANARVGIIGARLE